MEYVYENCQTYRQDDDGERELLANFCAYIDQETRYIDGRSNQTVLTIRGERRNPAKDAKAPILFPSVEVTADEFASMGWVMPNWGVAAVIRSGSGIKDDLRTAIQLQSQPTLRVIFRHIGWTELGPQKVRAYLHAGGAITTKGNDPRVTVSLPPELSRYRLDLDTQATEAAAATLALTKLADPTVTWPLLAATFAPLFGPVDFGIHLAGRTGTFKSEVMSLWQSHFGAEMDARHLPGSWSSTANALEAQAFLTCNAPFVVDDFVPTGSSWSQRTLQATADKLIRAAGNQSGRARLTDTSNLQTAMYPRGVVLSTGEDIPEGHSVRARLMILEIAPGSIEPGKLTLAQANRTKYPATTGHLVQWLAGQGKEDLLKDRAAEVRNKNLDVGHTRTPPMLGRLVATAEYFLDWCELIKCITPSAKKKLQAEAAAAIMDAGRSQNSYLESTDPTDVFCATVRHVIAAGLGHFRTINGGVPKSAEILGWTSEQSMSDLPTYKARGPVIGWVDWGNDEMLIDTTAGLAVVKKAAGNEISLTKQTLIKRLKDAGKLLRVDESRQRNMVRVIAEQHPRQVIALAISATLETQEVPSDEPADEDGE